MGGENIIRIYCMREKMFSTKGELVFLNKKKRVLFYMLTIQSSYSETLMFI